MSTEQYKTLVRRFIEQVYNQKRIEVLDELFAADFVNHDPAKPHVRTLDDLKQDTSAVYAALPDLQCTIDDLVAEGDKVAVRYTLRGTNRGTSAAFGTPGTGRKVTITAICIIRVAARKAVEVWSNWDAVGLAQQLGIIPPLGEPEG
jgi:steroid delta-isomerase-like uncharacterized protein